MQVIYIYIHSLVCFMYDNIFIYFADLDLGKYHVLIIYLISMCVE